VGSLRHQDGETRVGGPREERSQVVVKSIERPPDVPGEKCGCRYLGFIEVGVLDDGDQGVRV